MRYDERDCRFYWDCEPASSGLPGKAAVYCLFSHLDQRIQKVGKAEGASGLSQRFLAYTKASTPARMARDATDRLWQRVMTGPLRGQALSVYYLLTPPVELECPVRVPEINRVRAHWARDLETVLSKALRLELAQSLNSAPELLLSGID